MDKLLRDVGFVHLHVHSAYSLLEGALPIATLAKLALADRMPALALTDTNNLFGALEFSEKMAASGIQPIAGVQIAVDFDDRPSGVGRPNASRGRRGNIVLLAGTEEGYRKLVLLSSKAFLSTPAHDTPHVPISLLREDMRGLFALTGGPNGPLDGALAEGMQDLAEQRLQLLSQCFPGALYVELQRHKLDKERLVEPKLIDLAYAAGLPLVATNEAMFATAADHEAHDVLLALADGRVLSDESRRQVSPDHFFKTRAEMQAQFEDLPEAPLNSVEIAMRCLFRPRLAKPVLPRFTPDGDEASELRRQAVLGLERRLQSHGVAPGLDAKDYTDRLDFELDVIERMKYPGYFLIVADFIQWAKANDIPVGPGRGSGAGSLVAFALTITDLDPLRFNLLFERFLNPARVSMPDFDIDFCQDRREEVIRYVQKRFGHDRVAQIITFGTLLARGVMRDVGRVLEMPYGQVDKLTKLVPQNPAKPVTLDEAIDSEPKLKAAAEDEPVVGRMLGIARKLEGLYRHASTHAAGIVISDRPLEQVVPLYRDPKSDLPVTQFNMKWVESAGLVKFDFLGLKTLSVLRKALELLRERNVHINLETLPLQDAATYAMLARAETVGIFQLESGGMRRALAEMKPDRFEDIIALVALYRPGPMANIPVYCAVKHGLQPADYIHPRIESILKETFGVIVYQEQVMQIAQVLSGYSLGEADLLRRAMGKKIKAEMDAQRDRFVSGAVERGLSKGEANTIFDLLAKFADYGFNKSHAAAYALVAYQTAFLKANYPVEFLAASMEYEASNTEKLVEFRREAQRLGIDVEPPSVNASGPRFGVRSGAVRYALCAVKGVGVEAATAIADARGDTPFDSVLDFANRVNARALNRRTLETLIAAGALDGLGAGRAEMLAGADRILACAGETTVERSQGQSQLFGEQAAARVLQLPKVAPWTAMERLRREYEAIGFFLSGHPLDEFQRELSRMRVQRFADFQRSVRQGATVGRVAVTVLDRTERRTRTGSKMGILQLSDQSAQFEAILFAETLAQYRDILEPGANVVVTVQASLDADEMRVRVQSAQVLDRAMLERHKGVQIKVFEEAALPAIASHLHQGGDIEVSLSMVIDNGAEVELRLPGQYSISPGLLGILKNTPGVADAHLY